MSDLQRDSEGQRKAVPWYRSRGLRTVVLALTATATFVGAAILVFDVDWRVMLSFFLASLLGLSILMGAALLFTACRVMLRRWRDK